MIKLQSLLSEDAKQRINEENEYQKVVRKVMDMVDIDSIEDLNDDEKATFFSYLDTVWDKENHELRKEPEEDEIKDLMNEV